MSHSLHLDDVFVPILEMYVKLTLFFLQELLWRLDVAFAGAYGVAGLLSSFDLLLSYDSLLHSVEVLFFDVDLGHYFALCSRDITVE